MCGGYAALFQTALTTQYVTMYVCVFVYRDTVRDVVRLLLALNARSHAVSLARQTNVSLAD